MTKKGFLGNIESSYSINEICLGYTESIKDDPFRGPLRSETHKLSTNKMLFSLTWLKLNYYQQHL